MSLQIGAALQNGIDDLASERGALFTAVFVVLGTAETVFTESLSRAVTERMLSNVPGDAQAQAEAQEAAQASAFALDLPIGVALVAILALFAVGEVARIVAIRAFASDSHDPLPAAATRDMGSTAVRAVLAGVLVAVAVIVGTAILVVPGLVAAVFLLFVRQEIALNDSGVMAAVRNSLDLVGDNIVPMAALLVVLFLLGVVVTLPLQIVPVALPPTLTTTVSTVLGQIVLVYGIAVFTDAYQQVTAAEATATAEPAAVREGV